MYQLEVTDKQLAVIKTALEEYFRIELNQWWSVADRLSELGVDLSQENPRHKEIFDTYIAKRDDVRIVLEAAGKMLWPDFAPRKKSENCLIAEDIWATIKHQQWLDNEAKDIWTRDSAPVYPFSHEPLPKCTKVDGGGGDA